MQILQCQNHLSPIKPETRINNFVRACSLLFFVFFSIFLETIQNEILPSLIVQNVRLLYLPMHNFIIAYIVHFVHLLIRSFCSWYTQIYYKYSPCPVHEYGPFTKEKNLKISLGCDKWQSIID